MQQGACSAQVQVKTRSVQLGVFRKKTFLFDVVLKTQGATPGMNSMNQFEEPGILSCCCLLYSEYTKMDGDEELPLGKEFQDLSCCSVLYSEYTKIGGDEELPLGEEFQEHLKRFLRPSEKKVAKRIELVKKIVDQLA